MKLTLLTIGINGNIVTGFAYVEPSNDGRIRLTPIQYGELCLKWLGIAPKEHDTIHWS
jgi:hypothetical protein